MVLSFYPAGEVAVPEAAPRSDNPELASLIESMGGILAWDPYIIYGGLVLGVYQTVSSVAEVVYERACYEIAKAPKDTKGNFNFQSLKCGENRCFVE